MGANAFRLSRWTRNGILEYRFTPNETFENLVLHEELRERIQNRVEVFVQGKKAFHELGLPWRYGVFLFGEAGVGKTAASRAVARLLNWEHVSIPAHEILDSHFLERALAEVSQKSERVIVLEDVDLLVKVMDPRTFFSILDHASERSEGIFWIATSRHAENAPKTQLLRPGRFDESIRLEPPGDQLRGELLQKLLIQSDGSPIVWKTASESLPEDERSEESSEHNQTPDDLREEESSSTQELQEALENGEASLIQEDPAQGQEGESLEEWIELSRGLTYSHFEEIRQMVASFHLEKKASDVLIPTIRGFIEDQLIAGDRLGSVSDTTQDVQERVKNVDPRILMAALDMTDVFRTLIEKVITDAAENAKENLEEN